MRKLLATAAVGAALCTGLAAPGIAAAATHDSAASTAKILIGGRCEDAGWIRVNTSAVYVYAGPGTSYTPIAVANRGTYLSCYPIVVGDAYRLCGTTTPANGWIPVTIDSDVYVDGYVPSTCTTDA